MAPALLLALLVAGLLALLPVWRLHVAGWPPRSLFTAWVVYAVAIIVALRFPGAGRILVPILVLAYVAPFVAGPERLSRLLRNPRPAPGVVIDVTPRPAPELPKPPGIDPVAERARDGEAPSADPGASTADPDPDARSRG